MKRVWLAVPILLLIAACSPPEDEVIADQIRIVDVEGIRCAVVFQGNSTRGISCDWENEVVLGTALTEEYTYPDSVNSSRTHCAEDDPCWVPE